jgi:hypothetical protein
MEATPLTQPRDVNLFRRWQDKAFVFVISLFVGLAGWTWTRTDGRTEALAATQVDTIVRVKALEAQREDTMRRFDRLESKQDLMDGKIDRILQASLKMKE